MKKVLFNEMSELWGSCGGQYYSREGWETSERLSLLNQSHVSQARIIAISCTTNIAQGPCDDS